MYIMVKLDVIMRVKTQWNTSKLFVAEVLHSLIDIIRAVLDPLNNEPEITKIHVCITTKSNH